MPAAKQWESYFDPIGILESLGCRQLNGDIVEFGCGYGTFTIPAAQRTSGILYALDIEPLMVAGTALRRAQADLRNVVVEQRDFVEEGSGRESHSASFVLLFNILHIKESGALLQEAFRVLHPGGQLRRRAVRNRLLQWLTHRTATEDGSQSDREGEAELYDEPRLRALDRAIAALPVRYKEALVLTALQGLSHRAAADQLGITPKAVELRVHRARKRLQEQLQESKA